MDGGIKFKDSREVEKVEVSVIGIDICANSSCPYWEFLWTSKHEMLVGFFMCCSSAITSTRTEGTIRIESVRHEFM